MHITAMRSSNRCISFFLYSLERKKRGVHAVRGIMGNQGKFTEKQSRKTNVYCYISVLISHCRRGDPFSRFTSVFEPIE